MNSLALGAEFNESHEEPQQMDEDEQKFVITPGSTLCERKRLSQR